MATDIELPLGERIVQWTHVNYSPLTATINVTETAANCVSVVGGSCGSTTPPGVFASGFTVTGYLAELAGFTICDYVDSAGWDGMVFDHLMALYYQFIGLTATAETTRLKIPVDKRPATFPDTITYDQLIGTYYYFIGLIDVGNTKTGCSYT